MRKFFLNLALLLCALIVGSLNVWGTDVMTINVGSSSLTWTADGDNYKATSGDFSLRYEKADYSNSISGGIQSSELRLYSGTNFVISSSNTITQIVYNVADGTGKNYSVAALSTADGNLTDGTWTGSATSVSASLSAQNRIKSVTITYSMAYTITPTVNDADMGEVSLNGTTITASPNSGYRVKSDAEGYTITAGTATITHTGHSNTLTVSGSTDCTVQVNFEAIPTHTLSSAISPAAAGIVTLGSTTIAEGATTTATAAANAGYKFTGWSITGTEAEISSTSDNPTTVTMGTADATITATFEAVTTYAITYSINGNNTVVNVEKNAEVDLSAPTSGIPNGYTFIGWRTASLTLTDTDPADYVTSATSTANITYYAVMAVLTASLPDTYEKLSSNSFVAGATYLIGGKQSADVETIWYIKSYTNVDSNSDWGVATTTGSDAITFTLSGTANSLVVKDNNGNYLEGLSTGKFKMSSTVKTVYLDDSGNIRASSNGYYLRHNYNNGNGGYRWYSSSNAMNGFFYRVIKNNIYSNYCTTVPTATIAIAPACTDGEMYYGTYSNSTAFVVPSDLTVSTISVSGSTLTVSKYETGDVVKANTGVMVSAATSGSHTVTLTAETGIELADNMLKPSGDAGVNSTEMGIAAPSCKYYRLTMHNPDTENKIGFYWGAENGAAFDLAANKAYLAVPNGSSAPMRFWFTDEENNATNIENIESGEETVKFIENGQMFIKKNGVVYDVMGRVVR